MALRAILVATDFSPMAERALDFAISVATASGASITLLHVYDLPAFSLPPGILVPTEDIVGAVESASREKMDELVQKKRGAGVKIGKMLRDGVPWETIEGVAGEIGADLVVVGTHGRRGLSRALLGSVAERVLRTSKHPVLVVPAPA